MSAAMTAMPTRRQLRASRDQLDRALVWRARRAPVASRASARHAAFEALLPLAKSLASRYHRGEEPLEDLEQVAGIGLLKAIDGFDFDRGTSFSSYAVPTITGELRRHYRDKGWAVRVPRDLQELSLKLGKAQDAMAASLGRPPTVAELAVRLETTVERIAEVRLLGTAMRPVSLDHPLVREPGDEGETLVERLGDDDPGYAHTDDVFTARRLLDRLPERERRILELRFGEELTQTEIGARLGLSKMHVSRLLRRSLQTARPARRCPSRPLTHHS